MKENSDIEVTKTFNRGHIETNNSPHQNRFGDTYIHNSRFFDTNGECNGYSSVKVNPDGVVFMENGFGKMNNKNDHDHIEVNLLNGEMTEFHEATEDDNYLELQKTKLFYEWMYGGNLEDTKELETIIKDIEDEHINELTESEIDDSEEIDDFDYDNQMEARVDEETNEDLAVDDENAIEEFVEDGEIEDEEIDEVESVDI